jgi:predicted short-subunit dehydrogenase-like oxidoreductase (DUF2520 family)
LRARLHIVGCGRVGRALARLWTDAGVADIGWVLNRRLASARSAVDFVGAGTPVAEPATVAEGDWLMLSAPDGALPAVVERLSTAGIRSPAIAFHVSGAEPAEILRPLGAPVASVHPVCPFGDPAHALSAFPGSHALGEGDAEALAVVLPAFEAIGARVARFRPTDKRRYHAAAIAASNFLTVLDDLALKLAEAGGLERERALAVLVSLQRIALEAIERDGPQRALTGPIERGDRASCERLADVLADAPGDPEGTLLSLARSTVRLAAAKRGDADAGTDRGLAVFADRRGGVGDAGV